MKIKVRVVYDEKYERVFDVAVGRGDKTFKWLGLVASQRFALEAPVGASRRRDHYRGATDNFQLIADDIVLPNNEIPHPSSIISDFLLDGDEVTVNLLGKQALNKSSSPSYSKWSTIAFTSGGEGGGEDEGEEEEEDPSENVTNKNGMTEKMMEEAYGNFMKLILKSQLLDKDKIRGHMASVFSSSFSKIMPRFSTEDIEKLHDFFEEFWPQTTELFNHYARGKSMDHEAFVQFLSEADVFPLNTVHALSSRIYRKVSAAASRAGAEFSLGVFIAALILTAQTRHHDTFDKDSSVSTSTALVALQKIFSRNIATLAERMEFNCYLKNNFLSNQCMCAAKRNHDVIMQVFAKYAAKARELSTTMKQMHFAEFLLESGMHDGGPADSEVNLSIATNIFNRVRAGPIMGRQSKVEIFNTGKFDDGSDPEKEFTYCEFYEAVCYAGFFKFCSANAKNIDTSLSAVDSMIKGIMCAESSLTYEPPKEIEKKGRRGQQSMVA